MAIVILGLGMCKTPVRLPAAKANQKTAESLSANSQSVYKYQLNYDYQLSAIYNYSIDYI